MSAECIKHTGQISFQRVCCRLHTLTGQSRQVSQSPPPNMRDNWAAQTLAEVAMATERLGFRLQYALGAWRLFLFSMKTIKHNVGGSLSSRQQVMKGSVKTEHLYTQVSLCAPRVSIKSAHFSETPSVIDSSRSQAYCKIDALV